VKTKNFFICFNLLFFGTALQASIIKYGIATGIGAYGMALYYESNGDYNKAKRLFRKDRNQACNIINNTINNNCKIDLCKDIIKAIESFKSSKEQQEIDAQDEQKEKDEKNILDSDAYKKKLNELKQIEIELKELKSSKNNRESEPKD